MIWRIALIDEEGKVLSVSRDTFLTRWFAGRVAGQWQAEQNPKNKYFKVVHRWTV